jgi:hypothetical protein
MSSSNISRKIPSVFLKAHLIPVTIIKKLPAEKDFAEQSKMDVEKTKCVLSFLSFK